MPSNYAIARFGYLDREEYLNIGVLAWEVPEGWGSKRIPADTPLHKSILKNWSRVERAFPNYYHARKIAVMIVLDKMSTYGDYVEYRDRHTGQGAILDLSYERPYLGTPEEGIALARKHFLVEPEEVDEVAGLDLSLI